MFRLRRLSLAVAALACLLVASAASADPVNSFTAAGAPSLVKATTSSSYTITLTNDSLSPARAQRAKIGIPSGFTVDPLSVQATTTAVPGSCDASTWEADGTLLADQKINLRRPAGDSSSLCPGASLSVVFLAVSAATDGTYAWTTELLDDVTSFTLSGSDPSVVVDGTAPDVTITGKPADPSNESSPSFSFASSEVGSTFACKLDAEAFADCNAPQGYVDLPDGTHTFTARATDAAGNTGPEASHTWTIDTDAPEVTITAKPNDPSNESSPSFSFTSDESSGTFACKLDAGAFSPCNSPKSYTDLADGSHTFAVKATDPAGNTGPETTFTWTIDTVGPTTTISGKPIDPSNVSSPSFTFTSNEAGSTFACKLGAGAFAPCTSPKSYVALADGSHTFTVKATDSAGNTGPETSYTWTIDSAGPTVTITQKPTDPSNESSPSLGFSSDEPGSTFACKLDAGAFASCTSPHSYTDLADGSHTFTVKATDAAGNTGPEASHTWMIDTAAPTASIIVKPNDPSNNSSPSLSFTSDEVGSTFACKLGAQAFAACTSPTSYLALADGSHTFTVKATDAAGNTGPEASYTWTIDTIAPTAAITAKPNDPSNNSSPSFTFTSNEPGSTFACKLGAAAFAACTSPTSYLALADGAHTFTVKATDAAGNTGPEASFTWTIDTVGPTTTIDGKPSDPSNVSSPSFTFSSNEPGSTFACKLGAAAFAACTSPKSYVALADGAHTFTVKATDAAGNTGPNELHLDDRHRGADHHDRWRSRATQQRELAELHVQLE